MFGIKSKLLGIRDDKLYEKGKEKKKTENRNRTRDHYIWLVMNLYDDIEHIRRILKIKMIK